MRTYYEAGARDHAYCIDFDPLGHCFWAYPMADAIRDECVFSPDLPTPCECAQPPSDTLRTLIKADAPHYVILDRLIEEYPQWEPHFMAAATAHLTPPTSPVRA